MNLFKKLLIPLASILLLFLFLSIHPQKTLGITDPGGGTTTAPNPPTNLSTARACAGTSSNISFNWSASAKATSYKVKIGSSPEFTQSSPNYVLKGANAGTNYAWHVKACNSTGCSSLKSGTSVVALDCDVCSNSNQDGKCPNGLMCKYDSTSSIWRCQNDPKCSNSNHNGTCPSGQLCQYDSSSSIYRCQTDPKCSNANHNGTCPSGQQCQYDSTHSSWECKVKDDPAKNCKPADLKLDASANVISGKPGEAKSVTVSIDASKLSTCDLSFALSAVKPNENWKVDVSPSKVNVKTKQVAVKITSPSEAKGGTRTITIQVRKEGKDEVIATLNIKYDVLEDKAPTPKPTVKATATPKPTKSVTPTPKPTVKTPTPKPGACDKQNPTISVSEDSKNSKPGKKVEYEISIKNNDSAGCDPRTGLTLEKKLPGDKWVGSFNSSISKLSPNESKEVTLSVTSPSNASSGKKDITVNLKNSGGNVIATKTLEYNVTTNGGDTPTPDPDPDPTTPTPPPPSPEPGMTRAYFTVGLDGIGNTQRVPTTGTLGGNINPLHPNRKFTVFFYKAGNEQQVVFRDSQTFTYNSSSRRFEGYMDLPAEVKTDTYNVFITAPRYLTTRYNNSISITNGTEVTMPVVDLITGNINNNDSSINRIDLSDYQVLISCSIFSNDGNAACNENEKFSTWADLNDDGLIDQDDYTLWLFEVLNQEGAQLPNSADLEAVTFDE